jgi:hypothetical protein
LSRKRGELAVFCTFSGVFSATVFSQEQCSVVMKAITTKKNKMWKNANDERIEA